ncbi:MAG: LuxR C-terminal-related transcriptional regulator [Candidatus Baltobacteraceae bacterium]
MESGDLALPTTTSSLELAERAREFWHAGAFERCLSELDELPLARHSSETIFLRGRALLRLGRPREAADWLRLNEAVHGSDDARATHAMLLGAAAERSDDAGKAAELFERVQETHPHPTILAETAYYHALALWRHGKIDAAREALAEALAPGHDIVGARARALCGWIEIAKGRFETAATEFATSLTILERSLEKDEHLRATMLYAQSIIEAEVRASDLAALDRSATELAWADDCLELHVQTLRHLGLAFARAGDSDVAFARFTAAARLAPGTAWSVLAFAECANLAEALGEVHAARAFFRLALADADALDWNATEGEAVFALLLLALAAGRLRDGARARQYFDLYRNHKRLSDLSASAHDGRVAAFELHFGAVVAGASSGARDAARDLSAAARCWDRIGYVWRAAEARRDLRALSHYEYAISGEPDHEAAADQPRLTDRVTLTVEQDRVFRLALAGYSATEIGRKIFRAPSTVRNHLSTIYGLLDVRNRAELVAKCATVARLPRRPSARGPSIA